MLAQPIFIASPSRDARLWGNINYIFPIPKIYVSVEAQQWAVMEISCSATHLYIFPTTNFTTNNDGRTNKTLQITSLLPYYPSPSFLQNYIFSTTFYAALFTVMPNDFTATYPPLTAYHIHQPHPAIASLWAKPPRPISHRVMQWAKLKKYGPKLKIMRQN